MEVVGIEDGSVYEGEVANIEEEHGCGRSFRGAGSLIADMYGDGNYVDWYCSGPYITVSEYIAEKMASKGWRYALYGDP